MLIGVTSKNCGGAERFFSDFFSRYVNDRPTQHRLFFFTDNDTSINMESLGKLKTKENVIILSNLSNRLKNIYEPLEFLFYLIIKRINTVHITSYTNAFYSRLYWIKFVPFFLRPKIVFTIVDCEVPYALADTNHPKYKAYADKYLSFFRNIKVIAVLSWYEKFIEFSKTCEPFRKVNFMEAISSRYADIEKAEVSSLNKENLIVWAARLTEQKEPLMFLDAILLLRDEGFDFGKWRFELYGEGELSDRVEEYIRSNKLMGFVTKKINQKLDKVFDKSSCFVSTQRYENFPSLGMMEAMLSGNALIARNVGQTNLLLKDNKNGFILEDDSARGLADKIKTFISNPQLHNAMFKESLRLTGEVHTFKNFKEQMDSFWTKVSVLR